MKSKKLVRKFDGLIVWTIDHSGVKVDGNLPFNRWRQITPHGLGDCALLRAWLKLGSARLLKLQTVTSFYLRLRID
jgi:hypothetical protein